MSEVKIPSTGRIVMYYPSEGLVNVDRSAFETPNGVLPAIVMWEKDMELTLTVFTVDGPRVMNQIFHKSAVVDVGDSYWDWPEIK